ncbi:MAG: sodium-dependent transporter [Anaerolineaceae bacterium]|nr:sodium-dependent transporter [Anaerolineaceae bacterium]
MMKNEVKESTANPPEGRQFSTKMGVLLVALGSAVGLGNIWKFPALTGMNGGAAFVLLYLLCTLVLGLPVMIAEHAMGREGRKDAVGTMLKLAPKSLWWVIGGMGVLAAFLIMAFYSEVAGWVVAYISKAITIGKLSTSPETNSKIFTDLVTNPMQSLIWQWVVLLLTGIIIALGIVKGIEATIKRALPLLFILLVIVIIRSVTLPGAAAGLTFLFKPDWSKVTFNTVLIALGLAFFKLSVGMGCMMTYGAYFRKDQNIPATATRIVLLDLLISMMAGLAIFPAVFALGFEPKAGASLLFITIPAVFASMPFGNVFMVIFFLLTALAATGAILSLLEVITAFLEGRFKLSRKVATLITIATVALFGAPAALSNSTTANWTIFGKTFFDFYDYVTSNILLTVGGLLIAVFVGWVWGYPKLSAQLTNGGTLKNEKVVKFFFFMLKFVTPVLIFLILLSGFGLFKS